MADYSAVQVDPDKLREVAEAGSNKTLRSVDNALEIVTEDLEKLEQYWRGEPAVFYQEKLSSGINEFLVSFTEYGLYIRELLGYAERYAQANANATMIAEETSAEVANHGKDVVEQAQWAVV